MAASASARWGRLSIWPAVAQERREVDGPAGLLARAELGREPGRVEDAAPVLVERLSERLRPACGR